MDKVVSIVNQKPTNLEFELGIDGLSPKNIKVRFCLKTKEYHCSFDAKHGKGDNWSVNIPALGHLEKGAFPYHIEVIADGYYFEAAKGTANIVGSHDVYVKSAEKVKPAEEEKKEEKKAAPKKVEKKSEPAKKEVAKETVIPLTKPEETKTLEEVHELADEILAKHSKPTPKKAVKKEEKKPIIQPAAAKVEETDVIKRIIAETKNSKTSWKPTKVEKPVEPIIETEEKPVEEQALVATETDVIVKKLLEEQKKDAKKSNMKSAPTFKKGKVVVH